MVRISVTDGNQVHTYEVDSNEQVENLKALVQVQTSIQSHKFHLMYNGVVLKEKDKLKQKGIGEGDLLFMFQIPIEFTKKQHKIGIADKIKQRSQNKQRTITKFVYKQQPIQAFIPRAQATFLQLKDDPHRLQEISEAQPQLSKFIIQGNTMGLAEYFRKKHNQQLKKICDEENRFHQLSKDPLNPQYQKMLQSRIRRKNIDQNYELAQQHTPESFGTVTMLYIKASINKVQVQAFVDSGAQTTIMSQGLAEKCNLMRLVDKRAAGIAVGVGTCKIIGKIYAADMQIQGKYITCAFTIIQNNKVQFLLGLDMLKRFKCIIDLKKNELRMNDDEIVTKFLSEGDVKKNKNKEKPTKEQIEQKVKKITSMGFSKDQAMRALKTYNYNQEIASNILMQNKFGQ